MLSLMIHYNFPQYFLHTYSYTLLPTDKNKNMKHTYYHTIRIDYLKQMFVIFYLMLPYSKAFTINSIIMLFDS